MKMEGSNLEINVSYLTPFGQREMAKKKKKSLKKEYTFSSKSKILP